MAITILPSQAQKHTPLKLWYDTPAQYFEESMPIGNGKLGALVYGGTDDNVLRLNDITLWTGKPMDNSVDSAAYKHLDEVRKALFEEDYKRADQLQLHLQGSNSQYYMPLGTLHIKDHNSGTASGYRRELDIDSALCRDSYTRNGVLYTREYFASNPDKLIAIRIKADKPGSINCDLTLTSLIPHKAKAANTQLTMTGHAVGDPQQSTHYYTMLRTSCDGNTTAHDSTLTVSGASQLIIYLFNETSFNGADKHPVTEGAPYLETVEDEAWNAYNMTFDQLRSRHIADYRRLFGKFSLELGNARPDDTRTTERQLLDYTTQGGNNPYLEQLYVQFGRYLLISCSRTKNVPANLQGLWSTAVYSPWRSNYTVNINLEENYWPAEVANLGELTMPLYTFMGSLAANGKHSAKNYYGIDHGWCSSHNSDIWAMTNPVGEKRESPEWSNWNMGGAWLTQNVWEHYAYTCDKAYLRDVAYPLLKGASEFMLAWLIPNPKNPDELITAPSTSPENEYVTTDGYHGTTCYGGTADLAIIRELFINTISATKILKTDAALRRDLEQSLLRLHPYKIGKRGNLQEWYYDWDDYDWHHRHQSHLIGLYPGHHITLSDTPELATAAAKTLEIKGDMTTGWSTGWRINLWARLHDSRQAYHMFQKLLKYVTPDGRKENNMWHSGGTYPNLFDAHPPFQIDGNFGGVAGVCEMLIQSTSDNIELLTALPTQWSSGHVSGICARGGFEVDMQWRDGKVIKATISSKHGGTTTVQANGTSHKLKLKKGGSKTITF